MTNFKPHVRVALPLPNSGQSPDQFKFGGGMSADTINDAAVGGNANTSTDAFLDGRLHAAQPKSGYRAGTDAVMLAAAVPVLCRPGNTEQVLDAGAGVGVAGLCVAARCDCAAVTLVEREPDLCVLAARNMQRNGFCSRAVVIEGDLTGPAANLVARGLVLERFDHVLANPPFFDQECGTPAPDPLRARARAMGEGGLSRWAKFLAACARPGGSMTMIHKADALEGVLRALSRRFGSLRVLPIHSRADEPAQRILVQGIKGSRAPLQILPGFIVHEKNNSFTARANSVLRHGEALTMMQNV